VDIVSQEIQKKFLKDSLAQAIHLHKFMILKEKNHLEAYLDMLLEVKTSMA